MVSYNNSKENSFVLARENPFKKFASWYNDASKSGVKEPNAVCLATASKCGAPTSRMVLLKGFGEQGFVIYTNLNSKKGKNIKENPQAALCFYWPDLGKQIRIEGTVLKVSDEEADSYFASRSYKSKIGAWASKQSEPMESKADLVARIAKFSVKWAMGKVDRPPHWTGLRITPDYFEFWQESEFDIPNRHVFKLIEDSWYSGLLYP